MLNSLGPPSPLRYLAPAKQNCYKIATLIYWFKNSSQSNNNKIILISAWGVKQIVFLQILNVLIFNFSLFCLLKNWSFFIKTFIYLYNDQTIIQSYKRICRENHISFSSPFPCIQVAVLPRSNSCYYVVYAYTNIIHNIYNYKICSCPIFTNITGSRVHTALNIL